MSIQKPYIFYFFTKISSTNAYIKVLVINYKLVFTEHKNFNYLLQKVYNAKIWTSNFLNRTFFEIKKILLKSIFS